MVYLLNATPRAPADPSGMQNLQRRYGLDSLAASVARVDAQGNKIAANKLNKTYKKQITDLNLPGNTDIPKNKFYMDGLFAGIAQGEFAVAGRSDGIGSDGSAGYTPFTAAEIEEGFSLRPGELHGYVKYRPPSPNGGGAGAGAAGSKRIKTETPVTTPLSGTFQLDAGVAREDGGGGKSRTSRSHSEARTHHSRSRVATPSPPTTRSAAYSAAPPPAEESDEGNESSDDGSRFKQLERERKKKLRMKREAELALGGDYKRRRYDVDGYEFLDSD